MDGDCLAFSSGFLCEGVSPTKFSTELGNTSLHSVVSSCIKNTQGSCNPAVSFFSLGLRDDYIFSLGSCLCAACCKTSASKNLSNTHLSKLVLQSWWWSPKGFSWPHSSDHRKGKAMSQECEPWLQSQLSSLDTSELSGLISARCPVSLGKWLLSFLLLKSLASTKA